MKQTIQIASTRRDCLSSRYLRIYWADTLDRAPSRHHGYTSLSNLYSSTFSTRQGTSSSKFRKATQRTSPRDRRRPNQKRSTQDIYKIMFKSSNTDWPSLASRQNALTPAEQGRRGGVSRIRSARCGGGSGRGGGGRGRGGSDRGTTAHYCPLLLPHPTTTRSRPPSL